MNSNNKPEDNQAEPRKREGEKREREVQWLYRSGREESEEIWANIKKNKGEKTHQTKQKQGKVKATPEGGGKATPEGGGEATPEVAEKPPRRVAAQPEAQKKKMGRREILERRCKAIIERSTIDPGKVIENSLRAQMEFTEI
ncbi:unnamed protein product [Prunus armeniaca]